MTFSLFKPGKSRDYVFIDRIVEQQFNIAGVVVHVHKYLGPAAQDATGDVTMSTNQSPHITTIQDILFLENRDRRYAQDVVDLRAHYTASDLDFSLSSFGLFLNAGKTIFMNFHMNQVIARLGRKLASGDVIEITNKREETLIDPSIPFINAYYVVQDVARAAEGYSFTWLPHVLRVRAEPIADSQEFKSILDTLSKRGLTVRDMISTGTLTQEISDAIQASADAAVPTKNFDASAVWIDAHNPGNNLPNWAFNASSQAPNSSTPAPSGTRFPDNPMPGDYFLRTDYEPARMFQRQTSRWQAVNLDYRDRAWTPMNRTLENHAMPQPDVMFASEPTLVVQGQQPAAQTLDPRGTNINPIINP